MREKQRASRAVLIAVGIHVVVGAVLVQVLTFGHGIPSWLRFGTNKPLLEERLTYVAPREQPKPVAQMKPPGASHTWALRRAPPEGR